MPTNKYFQCPYCEKRFTREDLVRHLESKHLDELPTDFTPLRMAFHVVNRKGIEYRRPCRICKLPTDWDESKGRYNFLCNKKSCHDAWVKQMKDTMGDTMGSNRPTASKEGLEKMLKARKISGVYNYSNGDKKEYTGSYELKAIGFMDKVMNLKSEDIAMPGPVLYYELDGVKHMYIPDIYYIPYNLIIEVKDGGLHPNNKNMEETRKKQMAKEKFMIDNTNYNYLRLTDNDFSQLLAVFATLKLRLIDNDDSRVININEDATTIGAIPMNGVSQDGVVIVNYMKNNVFSQPDYAVADNFKLHNLVVMDKDNKLVREHEDFLYNTKFTTYLVKGDKNKIYEALLNNIDKVVDGSFIYETVFGHKCYSDDQILFESSATQVQNLYEVISNDTDRIQKYIKGE